MEQSAGLQPLLENGWAEIVFKGQLRGLPCVGIVVPAANLNRQRHWNPVGPAELEQRARSSGFGAGGSQGSLIVLLDGASQKARNVAQLLPLLLQTADHGHLVAND